MAYLGFYFNLVWYSGAYRGFKPPSPEMFRFLVESEGKEVESKRKKMKGMGVGCKLLIYFLGLRYFQGGLRNFRGGVQNFSGRGGQEIIFLWGVEKFSGGGLKNFFLGGGEL